MSVFLLYSDILFISAVLIFNVDSGRVVGLMEGIIGCVIVGHSTFTVLMGT